MILYITLPVCQYRTNVEKNWTNEDKWWNKTWETDNTEDKAEDKTVDYRLLKTWKLIETVWFWKLLDRSPVKTSKILVEVILLRLLWGTACTVVTTGIFFE